ncbi:MAG: DNA mismatch repair endonuclease MutL [bacterium]
MIKILDNNLINKIAAGEVVERPASVIKELVENSLDAGADFITVEIKNGGIDFIEVVDNGKGMNREDASLCVERHATSKISSVEDLSNILSFGFRGEALAAISSVSKFSVQTKEIGAVVGTMVENNNTIENDFKVSEIGCAEGTRIRVENIFFNVPARRKFLKGLSTEFGHILNTFVNIALVNYRVRFKFIHNGKVVFDYHQYANIRGKEHESARIIDEWSGRVKEILGSDNFSNMIPFHQETGEMIIEGFVSRPEATKINKSHQYLFVNSRPVYNNIVHKAIYDAYRNLIPASSHPSFIIKLDLEPELVDVNVHPRKMDVKFLQQQEIFKITQATVRETLIGKELKNLSFAGEPFVSQGKEIKKLEIRNWKLGINNQNREDKISDFKMHTRGLSAPFIQQIKKQSDEIKNFNNEMFRNENGKKESLNWRLVGQIKNLYLIIETPESLVLIDQHAAHERDVYDKLTKDVENKNFKKQQFLMPLKIELSISEMDALKKGLCILEKIGFEVEEFGVNTIIVQTAPSDIADKNIVEIIKGLISDIFSNMSMDLEAEEKIIEARDRIIKYISCHSAIRGGDIMTQEEQMALTDKVVSGKIKSTCPHGRPIMTMMSWDEIGKRFKRI